LGNRRNAGGAEPRLSRLHARSRTPLPLVQWEVVWDVVNGLDSQFFQFLNRTGMDSGYIADVVIWARGIAAVVELARDGVGAMGTHWYWRRLRKSQYSKFRPEQESELRLEPLDSLRQVSDLEEPSHIDGAAVKNIVSIDVG
jgi:hypothetical protein